MIVCVGIFIVGFYEYVYFYDEHGEAFCVMCGSVSTRWKHAVETRSLNYIEPYEIDLQMHGIISYSQVRWF